MATKYCEVCSLQVINLRRHLNSKKHLRFQDLQEYGNYGDQQPNNILGKQLKDKGHTSWLGYLYVFFAYIFNMMRLQRIKR
jgi:hypothetical protein